jgi:hypothetical protein
MDPTLWRDVDPASAVLFFAIVVAIPLLAMLFYPSTRPDQEYVDEHQGLGDIEDDWGLGGLTNGRAG